MAGFLDNSEFEIPCAKCNRKTQKSIGWIKSHSEFTCSCGTVIPLDTSQFKSEIAKVEAAYTSLQNTLKKFNK